MKDAGLMTQNVDATLWRVTILYEQPSSWALYIPFLPLLRLGRLLGLLLHLLGARNLRLDANATKH